jgi:hypothetical protein
MVYYFVLEVKETRFVIVETTSQERMDELEENLWDEVVRQLPQELDVDDPESQIDFIECGGLERPAYENPIYLVIP